MDKVAQRFEHLAAGLKSALLFGSQMTAADAYLYVMLRWAGMKGVALPPALLAYPQRLEGRPAVRQALQHEGLSTSSPAA